MKLILKARVSLIAAGVEVWTMVEKIYALLKENNIKFTIKENGPKSIYIRFSGIAIRVSDHGMPNYLENGRIDHDAMRGVDLDVFPGGSTLEDVRKLIKDFMVGIHPPKDPRKVILKKILFLFERYDIPYKVIQSPNSSAFYILFMNGYKIRVSLDPIKDNEMSCDLDMIPGGIDTLPDVQALLVEVKKEFLKKPQLYQD